MISSLRSFWAPHGDLSRLAYGKRLPFMATLLLMTCACGAMSAVASLVFLDAMWSWVSGQIRQLGDLYAGLGPASQTTPSTVDAIRGASARVAAISLILVAAFHLCHVLVFQQVVRATRPVQRWMFAALVEADSLPGKAGSVSGVRSALRHAWAGNLAKEASHLAVWWVSVARAGGYMAGLALVVLAWRLDVAVTGVASVLALSVPAVFLLRARARAIRRRQLRTREAQSALKSATLHRAGEAHSAYSGPSIPIDRLTYPISGDLVIGSPGRIALGRAWQRATLFALVATLVACALFWVSRSGSGEAISPQWVLIGVSALLACRALLALALCLHLRRTHSAQVRTLTAVLRNYESQAPDRRIRSAFADTPDPAMVNYPQNPLGHRHRLSQPVMFPLGRGRDVPLTLSFTAIARAGEQDTLAPFVKNGETLDFGARGCRAVLYVFDAAVFDGGASPSLEDAIAVSNFAVSTVPRRVELQLSGPVPQTLGLQLYVNRHVPLRVDVDGLEVTTKVE